MTRSLEVQFLKNELLRLKQELYVRPIGRMPVNGTLPKVYQVWIIGGNALVTGQNAIQYKATVTPTQVYNPDVDMVYQQGLGNAWLYIDGVRQMNRVLVRHDFDGYTQPLLAGRIMGVRGPTTLTFSGTNMNAYTLRLP